MRGSRTQRGGAVAVLLLALAGAGDAARAQEHGEHALGSVDFRSSCAASVQAQFNRAVALLHHMTYPAARAAFGEVARADPRCGMAHWGTAMTLFQPLWPTRPGPAELRQGWEAVEEARRLGAPTERERMLVAAAAAFFREPEATDYWQRIRRWEEAMASAHAAFPGDQEVTAFYALAHLAAAPPDAESVAAHNARAASLLLEVYRQNPSHPGAMHYLVHANDAPGREREQLEITRKYAATAPRNPHALHMPTHIYTRLGDWPEVVRGNLLAAEAALEIPAGDRGQYVWDEFPHAVEYLVYAYLQQGADSAAAAEVTRLRGTDRLQPTFKTAFHLASTAARYALERQAWEEAAALVPRQADYFDWDRFTWPEAVTWFARGLGAAHGGRVVEAQAAIDRLGRLAESARTAGEDLFQRNIEILRLEVRAWVAQAEADTTASLQLMREAAELERATPKHVVTPGPELPADELQGDLLLAQGRAAEALAAYRTALRLYPNRFNSLWGAARAAAGAGAAPAAREYYRSLLAMAPGSARPAVAEARQALAAEPGK